MRQNNNLQNPRLIIIRGLPGSGKSYIADNLTKVNFNVPVSIVDPDRIDFESKDYKDYVSILAKDEVDPQFYPYRFLRNAAYETIKRRGLVIWTQAFTNLEMLDKTIKNLENYAKEHNLELEVLVVEVEVDESTARNRTKEREKKGKLGVSDENFKRFVNDYTTFISYGYRTITVDGNGSVENSTEKIMRELPIQ